MTCTNTHLTYKCTKSYLHKGACLAYKGNYALAFTKDSFIFKNSIVTAAWLEGVLLA